MAKLGPERNASREPTRPGSTALSTSSIVSSVWFSIPFDAEITIVSGSSDGAARPNTSRTVCDGTTLTTNCLPAHARARSSVAVKFAGSFAPGR